MKKTTASKIARNQKALLFGLSTQYGLLMSIHPINVNSLTFYWGKFADGSERSFTADDTIRVG